MTRLPPSFIIAAPSSGSGKTSVTLGLLRWMKRQGLNPCAGKMGPDYIDPGFHAVASGAASLNFDPWSMQTTRLGAQFALSKSDQGCFVLESAMGLFDGAADGTASTADLAKTLNMPIVLLVDCKGMAGSVAALVHGFQSFDPALKFAGLILNRVASPKHEAMLVKALEPLKLPILAVLPPDKNLHLPSRHLGLVQAQDRNDLDATLDKMADWVEAGRRFEFAATDLGRQEPLAQRASSFVKSAGQDLAPKRVPALGKSIAVVKDAAFSFIYPHLIDDWQVQGARITYVSALANEVLPKHCDAIFLPGGYPELHASALSQAQEFWASLHQAVGQGAWVYGECGGYMALGQAIIDAQGQSFPMAGLLGQITSFDQPKRHLGYRYMQQQALTPFGPIGAKFKGHEFHYSVEQPPKARQSLWQAQDAPLNDLGLAGQINSRVFGSYLHLVDTNPM